jgi:hypothetical protein
VAGEFAATALRTDTLLRCAEALFGLKAILTLHAEIVKGAGKYMGFLVWNQPVLAEIDDDKIANSCQPLSTS